MHNRCLGRGPQRKTVASLATVRSDAGMRSARCQALALRCIAFHEADARQPDAGNGDEHGPDEEAEHTEREQWRAVNLGDSGRCGDILAALASAAQVDEDLARRYAEGQSRHIEGSRQTSEHLKELEGLRDDVMPERAAAMLGTLTLPVVWAMLTRDYGWTFDDAEAWIFSTLRGQLLAG